MILTDGSISQTSENETPKFAISVPDIDGLTLEQAALAYAKAGWFVLPVKPGTKNPGSVVGAGWQHQSSRDPKQIEQWWSFNPDFGIALQVGRSGAVAFDLDCGSLDELPQDLADGLRLGRVQLSRQGNTSRGHYLFATSADEFGNGAGAFRAFGEVRGRGGVIIAAPTRHVKADGEYRWVEAGRLPSLPDAVRSCLSTATTDEAEPLTDSEFEAFLSEPAHLRSERPWALAGVLNKFEDEVREEGSIHEALSRALPWALREVCAGCYPATEAVEQLQDKFNDSFTWETRKPDGRDRSEPNEFYRMATWAAAQAKLADPAETRERLDRKSGSSAGSRTVSGPLTASLAGVAPTRVDWLWWPWIPFGRLTMFEGEPDVGKSTMTLTWSAAVTRGGPWPETEVGNVVSLNERGLRAAGGVLLVGVEDDISDTVVPRLMAAGADLNRVRTFLTQRDDKGQPVPFIIPDDVHKLRAAIEESEAVLVIVDPISAFMSETVKAGSDTSNRKALMMIADVAAETGAAVVLVRHLNKGTGMSAKHRGGGSIAYTALARSSILAAKLPPDDDNTEATHGLASIKNNLAKAPKTIGYRLESSPSNPEAPIVDWVGSVDATADEMVGAEGTDARKASPTQDEAEAMIRALLADGPKNAADVRKVVAAEVGCSPKTVANAANRIPVLKTQQRSENGSIASWTWQLSGRIKLRGGGPDD